MGKVHCLAGGLRKEAKGAVATVRRRGAQREPLGLDRFFLTISLPLRCGPR